MEAPFSNREIREMFDDIKGDLSDIKVQTTKTNGRVTSLELSRAEQDGIYKATAIASTLAFSILMAVTGYVLTQVISIDSRITSAISAALAPFEDNK